MREPATIVSVGAAADGIVGVLGPMLRIPTTHAIDTLILDDQAKRSTILEEAVLRARTPDDREAQH